MIHPCELLVICDGLGIEEEHLARITDQDISVVQGWMSGQVVDEASEAKIRAAVSHTASIVSAMTQAVADLDDRVVRIYTDDESMWRDHPDFFPYPARWLRTIAFRVIEQLDGVNVWSA